jgi:hypothetical protein
MYVGIKCSSAMLSAVLITAEPATLAVAFTIGGKELAHHDRYDVGLDQDSGS